LKPEKPVHPSRVYGSIAFAFILWFIIFVVQPFPFFLMMSISTLLLSVMGFKFGWPLLTKEELNLRNLFLGIFTAIALYALFVAGNRMLTWISEWTGVVRNHPENLRSIYAIRGSLPSWLEGFLLFFPIGFGEEVFWRGYVQKFFTVRWNRPIAFGVTTLLYTLVHVPNGNPVLTLAALTCGLFWGGMYAMTGRLLPVLISHMLWDPLIFVIFPLR
jgi:membrane protease YdiL (CAAX protease family)